MVEGTVIEGGFWDGAEVISVYTRATAIEDGVLADVSKMAAEAGFVVPVAITAAVFAEIERGKGSEVAYFEGRLWDVLWLARLAARRGGDRIAYKVKIGRKVHRLIAHSGPGDHGEHVVTIGYAEDF